MHRSGKGNSMQCITCGSDQNDSVTCSSCSQGIDNPTHEFNIEYKDFKISELLEITHTKCEVKRQAKRNSLRQKDNV